jgi:hypothetical protein
MDKKFLYLYIGYPKSASSYLSKNVKNIFSEIKHIDVNYNHYEYKLLYKIFNSTSSEFLRDYKKLENDFDKILLAHKTYLHWEGVLNLLLDYKKKILFIKRIKKICIKKNIKLKVIVSFRNHIDLIISFYKENYTRLILKNLRYLSFVNFFNVLFINNNYKKNLDYKKLILDLIKVLGKKNLKIVLFEDFTNNPNFFKSLAFFFKVKSYKINKISNFKINSSTNHNELKIKILSNFQLYIKNKKKFSFKTIINFFELIIKFFFLTKYLSNKNFQKEINMSKKNKFFLDANKNFVQKYRDKYI